LSDFYYHEYLDILKKINIKKMKIMPRVTKHIDDIIEYIQKLINLKKAYVSNGDVYFNIDTVSDSYGILSKQNLSNLLKGAKNEENVNKKNPLDFVL
jgi:cysteinyl-tRNA synthetase